MEVTAVSQEGEVFNVVLDLEIRRHFNLETAIHGRLFLNGAEYISQQDTRMAARPGDAVHGTRFFPIRYKNAWLMDLHHMIMLDSISIHPSGTRRRPQFNAMYFAMLNEERIQPNGGQSALMLFAPAETVEDIENVMRYFYVPSS